MATHYPLPCGCMLIQCSRKGDEYVRDSECTEHEFTTDVELDRLITLNIQQEEELLYKRDNL